MKKLDSLNLESMSAGTDPDSWKCPVVWGGGIGMVFGGISGGFAGCG